MDDAQLVLEEFIEGLPIGIIVLDTDLNVLAWNKMGFHLLGIEVEDLILGQFDTVIDVQPLRDALSQARNKSAGKNDFIFQKESQFVKCTVDRLQFESNKGDKLIVILEDTTKYRKLESMKQEFMQIILHRIRNPLSTLKTSLSIVNSGKIAEVPEEFKEILDMSTHEVNRLNVLLNDLRNLYVIETGLAGKELDLENFSAADLLDRAVGDFLKLYRNNDEIKKCLSLKGDLDSRIQADFEKLKQVFVILLSNAFDFSPDNPQITLIVSQNDGQTTIEVKDNGIGIADNQKEYVFTKFFRGGNRVNRTKEGNGLGLFIARALIELMKGTMYFESSESKGSSFFVSIPSE